MSRRATHLRGFWLLAVLLQGMYSLESTGTVSIEAALGTEGEVYATVPKRGAGRGQVRVRGHKPVAHLLGLEEGELAAAGADADGKVCHEPQSNSKTLRFRRLYDGRGIMWDKSRP